MSTKLQVICQSGDNVILIRKCPCCGRETRKEMNVKEFNDGVTAYQMGALIQAAFPKADASTRELLMTGICDACFGSL
jgi:hypothetical protein